MHMHTQTNKLLSVLGLILATLELIGLKKQCVDIDRTLSVIVL